MSRLFIMALDALLRGVPAFCAMAADAAIVHGFCSCCTHMTAAGRAGLSGSAFMMADGALADALCFVLIVIENDAFCGFVFSFCDGHSSCREEHEWKKKNERKSDSNIPFHIGK